MIGIPLSWKIGAAAVLVALLAAGHLARVNSAFDAGHKKAVDDRAARDGAAIITRVAENAKIGARQDATNVSITKAKNEELAPVVKRIYVDRVRVGASICGPAAPAQAEDASGGDRGDPAGRLVSERAEEDIRALKVAVEEHLATGRACQAWGRENGFVP